MLVCYHTACDAACARGGEHRCVRLSVRPQVLADARLRKAYDYALEHPDEHMYNSMRYYNAAAVKYWKTDARAVVLSIIAVVSGIQYANQYWVYESVRLQAPLSLQACRVLARAVVLRESVDTQQASVAI